MSGEAALKTVFCVRVYHGKKVTTCGDRVLSIPVSYCAVSDLILGPEGGNRPRFCGFLHSLQDDEKNSLNLNKPQTPPSVFLIIYLFANNVPFDAA
jgi:hypothetical protein